MFKMLGKEIHHRTLKVVFENVSVLLQLLAHEFFNNSGVRKGSVTGTLTRESLFSLFKCENEEWLCKTE